MTQHSTREVLLFIDLNLNIYFSIIYVLCNLYQVVILEKL